MNPRNYTLGMEIIPHAKDWVDQTKSQVKKAADLLATLALSPDPISVEDRLVWSAEGRPHRGGTPSCVLTATPTSIKVGVYSLKAAGISIEEPILADGSNVPTDETADAIALRLLERFEQLLDQPTARMDRFEHADHWLDQCQAANEAITALANVDTAIGKSSSWIFRAKHPTPYREDTRDQKLAVIEVYTSPGFGDPKHLCPAPDARLALREMLPSQVRISSTKNSGENHYHYVIEPAEFIVHSGEEMTILDEMKALAPFAHIEPPYFQADGTSG